VVAGETSDWGVSADFALARYLTDGTLDTSFGVDGKVVTTFSGFSDATSVVLQNDGKIVAAGQVEGGDSYDFALARYRPDGSLDSGFGDDGLVTTNFAGADSASALIVDSAGRIVAAGEAYGIDNVGASIALARYRDDGSLDPTFGTGGKAMTETSASTVATSLVAQGDKLVVGGTGDALTLARFQDDGTLDPSFGTDGVHSTSFGSDFASVAALALDRRGRVVAGGVFFSGPDYRGDFLVARYR
jgi:uncharacterized delta-60 repeat protein